MPDIFISYASEDIEIAKKFALALEDNGFDVWWDHKIPTGQTYDTVIENALGEARCVLVLWSKHSVISEWVKSEANEGRLRDVLIPIRIEDVKIPIAFSGRQTADLIDSDLSNDDSVFQSVINDIRKLGIPNVSESNNAKNQDRIGAVQKKPVNRKFILLAIFISIAVIAAMVIYKMNNQGSPDLKTDTPKIDVRESDPIDFNVNSNEDSIYLVFRSNSKQKIDTFAIAKDFHIGNLKDALIRHYKIQPPKRNDEEGYLYESGLSINNRLIMLNDLSLSIIDAKNYDPVGINYYLTACNTCSIRPQYTSLQIIGRQFEKPVISLTSDHCFTILETQIKSPQVLRAFGEFHCLNEEVMIKIEDIDFQKTFSVSGYEMDVYQNNKPFELDIDDNQ